MKRIYLLLMLAAMFAFVSCGTSTDKQKEAVETEVPAEAEDALADEELENVEDAEEEVSEEVEEIVEE